MNTFLKNKTLGLFVKTKGLLSKPLLGGLGHIFLLHRVLPENMRKQYKHNYNLAITPEYLEQCILYLKKNGYCFISLDEVYEIMKGEKSPKKKFVALTFDDGYRDNLEYGLPILKRHNIPATIYITNCFPNSKAIFWWYLIEEIITNQSRFVYTYGLQEKVFEWSDNYSAGKSFMEIRNLIKITPRKEFRNAIKKSFGVSDDYLQKMCFDLSLTWNEINQLNSEPLITIGAHTVNHLPLALMEEQDVFYELNESKNELEGKIGNEVLHFAYPYGSFQDAYLREYRIAEKVGFKTSTINFPGNIFSENGAFSQSLPRMSLGNNVSFEKLNEIINGITHFGSNEFRKAIIY